LQTAEKTRRAHDRSHVTLGAFRLFLAFCVFSSHSLFHPIPGNFDPGPVGVFLFFIASGFIISDVLDNTYRGRPGSFLLNRATRLYPALWFTLLLAVICLFALRADELRYLSIKNWSAHDELAAVLILPAYPINRWGPLSNGWSLTIECSFYVAAAAATLVLKASNNPLRFGGWIALACYMIAVLCLRFDFENPILATPFFVFGIAIWRQRSADGVWSDRALAALALFLSLFSMGIIRWGELDRDHGHNLLGLFTRDGLELFCSIIPSALFYLCLVLVFLLISRWTLSAKARRLDAFLGDLTYPLYLTHIIVVSVVQQPGSLWAEPFFGSLLFVICCAVAYGVHVLIERPTASIRSRIRIGSPSTDPPYRYAA
jgi:peptidoglycan/LPS O-acetylase OafA/YrhL